MALLETATFRLAAGVNEDNFLVTDKRVQSEFFYQQPGFARRTTARNADGEWLVVLLWASDSDASVAQAGADRDPAVAAFSEMIDAGSIDRRRYQTLD